MRFDWRSRSSQHSSLETLRCRLTVPAKADMSQGRIVFGRLLQIEKRSFQVKRESGKRSHSGEHNILDWLEYTRFVLTKAGRTPGHIYPQRLLLWMRHTLQEKPHHKNYHQFLPGKFLVGTGRNRFVSLHQLALIGPQQWSRRWSMSLIV